MKTLFVYLIEGILIIIIVANEKYKFISNNWVIFIMGIVAIILGGVVFFLDLFQFK